MHLNMKRDSPTKPIKYTITSSKILFKFDEMAFVANRMTWNILKCFSLMWHFYLISFDKFSLLAATSSPNANK